MGMKIQNQTDKNLSLFFEKNGIGYIFPETQVQDFVVCAIELNSAQNEIDKRLKTDWINIVLVAISSLTIGIGMGISVGFILR